LLYCVPYQRVHPLLTLDWPNFLSKQFPINSQLWFCYTGFLISGHILFWPSKTVPY
jgi:hypothetical protein